MTDTAAGRGRRFKTKEAADAYVAHFDAIHLSPPCQPDSTMSNCRPGLAATYARLIEPARGGSWKPTGQPARN